jgi:hypothetical protein
MMFKAGDGFSVAGQAMVSGSGVLIVNAPGKTGGVISFFGQATVALGAPSDFAFCRRRLRPPTFDLRCPSWMDLSRAPTGWIAHAKAPIFGGLKGRQEPSPG